MLPASADRVDRAHLVFVAVLREGAALQIDPQRCAEERVLDVVQRRARFRAKRRSTYPNSISFSKCRHRARVHDSRAGHDQDLAAFLSRAF